MIDQTELRACSGDDLPGLKDLYAKAFPDEDLFPVVKELSGGDFPVLSIVATHAGAIVGHVAFTTCEVSPDGVEVSLLAPLCAAPRLHRQGIGSALVREGFKQLNEVGHSQVLVLGDPAYYSRFGFLPDNRIEPPYKLPEAWSEAWQSVHLRPDSAQASGKLLVPPPWDSKALWAP